MLVVDRFCSFRRAVADVFHETQRAGVVAVHARALGAVAASGDVEAGVGDVDGQRCDLDAVEMSFPSMA
jgi:hypothetical protein